jgi:hypothetical protein
MADDKEIDDGLTEEERAALADEDDGSDPTESNANSDEGDDNDAGEDKGDDKDVEENTDLQANAAGNDPDPDDKGGEANSGDAETAAQQGAPILVVEPLTDAETKLKDIGTKKEELITKFDDGEITAKEYQKELDTLAKQEREIELAMHKAQLAQEMEQQRLKNEWQATVNSFIDANPVYKDNQRLYRALDQEVRDVASSEEGKAMSGAKILAKAHENLMAAFNLAKPQPSTDKPKPPKPDVPPSLHGVPAADANDVSGGKYAALDRLASTNPIAYEEALMKLPEEERNAYLASA